MKTLTSPQDEATARKYVDLLRQNDFDQIENDMDPRLRSADLHSTLLQMAKLIPAERPISIKVVGMFRELSSSATNITLEYEFQAKWLLANVATRTAGNGAVMIVGFHVVPVSDSVEHQNRFTLIGKGTAQYGILFLSLLSSLVSFYGLFVCLRTTISKKWLWGFATLLGIGNVGVNWTTGQTGFTLLAAHLPTSGAAAPIYGPWVVYTSLPLGAILFLLRRSEFWGSADVLLRLRLDDVGPVPGTAPAANETPIAEEPQADC